MRAPYQRHAIEVRQRQPLFERQAAGKASLARVQMILLRDACSVILRCPRSGPRRRRPLRLSSILRGAPAARTFRMTVVRPHSRDASASELCHATARKPFQLLPRREAERRETHPNGVRSAAVHALGVNRLPCGARPARWSVPQRGKPATGTLAFRRSTAALRRGFGPDSARAALPGTTGCKREDPPRHQCSEHLAVRHVPDGLMPRPPAAARNAAHGNRSRSASRSTLAKAMFPDLTDAL